MSAKDVKLQGFNVKLHAKDVKSQGYRDVKCKLRYFLLMKNGEDFINKVTDVLLLKSRTLDCWLVFNKGLDHSFKILFLNIQRNTATPVFRIECSFNSFADDILLECQATERSKISHHETGEHLLFYKETYLMKVLSVNAANRKLSN